MKKWLKLYFTITIFILIPLFSLFSQETGDVNYDNSVDIIDALITAQYYVGLDPVIFFPELADVNCDGQIDIIDALIIAQYYVGLLPGFINCATPAPTLDNTDPPGETTPTAIPTETPAVEPTPPSPNTGTPSPEPTPVPEEVVYISPVNIDFGDILPGQITVKSLTVENTSTKTINITGISLLPANLFSWGNNPNGQLGVVLPDGTLTAIPQGIGLENIVSVETFYSSTFIITGGGSCWACGYNNAGQLGCGTTENQDVPVLVIPEGVTKVSSGMEHTLFIKTDGSLWGCGDKTSGALGLSNTSVDTTIPVQIMASGVVDIAAGGAFSYVLKEDGTLWSFGVNHKGQLGLGDTEKRLTPVLVNAGDVIKVAAGWNHAVIMKSDGSLWTCGQNTDGELGDGTCIDSSVFIKVIDNSVKDVKAGSSHTLVRLNNNNLVGCGSNMQGQLGAGSLGGSTSFISIAADIAEMDAGAVHTLFIKSDGSLWGCGSNGLGQLADDLYDDKLEPVMIYDSGVVQVCGGFSHSVALRTPTGLVFSHNGDYPVTLSIGQGYTFNVTMESAIEGSFGGVITINTNTMEKPVIHIPLWGNVSP